MMKRAICGVKNLFFPRFCIICKKQLLHGEEFLCNKCLDDIPYTYHYSYPENEAYRRVAEQTDICSATTLFFYRKKGGYRDLIREFKYRNSLELGRRLSTKLAEQIVESGRFGDIECVVGVPLHPVKRFIRGFNQATVIANQIATTIGIEECDKLLKRVRFTKTQTDFTMKERRKNVANAFKLDKRLAEKLLSRGVRNILIVDDVMTTGATLIACTAPLIQAGFRVSIATLAFAEE